MKWINPIAIALAIAFAIAELVLCSIREDGEITAFIEENQTAVLNLPDETDVSFFVCLPSTIENALPSSITFSTPNDGSIDIELSDGRPLTLPADFAEKNHIMPDMKCGVSESLVTSFESHHNEDVTISAPDMALVIVAVSPSNLSIPAYLLFFGFLFSLFTALCRLSQTPSRWHYRFKRYDGVIAIFGGLFIAIIIGNMAAKFLHEPSSIIPSYGEMLVMLATNFIAFILVVFILAVFRNHKKLDNDMLNALKFDDTKTFKPWFALVAALMLAGLGIVITACAPIPELSDIEMASQLLSTGLMTAIFAILAGVSEECLFRGVIQSSLEAKPDSKHPKIENAVAIAAATTLFVAIHVPQSIEHLWALIPIAGVSIFSGCLKIRFRSIFPCIILHMTYNTILLLPSLFFI